MQQETQYRTTLKENRATRIAYFASARLRYLTSIAFFIYFTKFHGRHKNNRNASVLNTEENLLAAPLFFGVPSGKKHCHPYPCLTNKIRLNKYCNKWTENTIEQQMDGITELIVQINSSIENRLHYFGNRKNL